MTDKPTPPALTNDIRRAALDKAIDIRKRQAVFKREMKDGKHPDIARAISMCINDEALSRLKVRTFMESLPTIGKVTAQSLMKELGIADSRRMAGLGDQQRRMMSFRLRLIPGLK